MGKRIRYNPKGRYPDEREHISLEMRADEERPTRGEECELYVPQNEGSVPQQNNASGSNGDRFIECIVSYAAGIFSYDKEQKKLLREELKETNVPPEVVSGILYHFHSDQVPVGYSVVKDPHLGQVIFVENQAIDYLVKHLGKDMDLSTPEGVLAMRDNPNIIVEELLLGMAAVARLEKVFSGRPLREQLDPYARKYGKTFPDDEHLATKTLDSAFERPTTGRGKDI